MGRRVEGRYPRGWLMEPLAPAVLARATPPGVDVRFHDDRLEPIPFDDPTDLVALSVETYTARRAYQIASAYRRRGVPVVMGGFHPTLVPEDASRFAEAVVVGPGEAVWPQVVADAAAGRLARVYRARPGAAGVALAPRRSLFDGRRYLPLALVETARGCPHGCDFCAVRAFFGGRRHPRPVGEIVEEVRAAGRRPVFLVDDNLTADPVWARELFTALLPHRVRWVSQASVDAGRDEGTVALMRASGCQALLVGFESLEPDTLRRMRKPHAARVAGLRADLTRLARHGIEIYATFLFGYDGDGPAAFETALAFALESRFFVAAFNHLVPFPGTELYERLRAEGRLLHERWWLDPAFRFGMVPFAPRGMGAEELRGCCLDARRRYYAASSILRRAFRPRASLAVQAAFWSANLLLRREVHDRDGYPLGDEGFTGEILEAPAAPVIGGALGAGRTA